MSTSLSMRFFPIRIKLANEATVQGSHDADARKQRWPARRRDQDQRFRCRLPLLGLVLGLRKLRDVPAGILERDELVPARQRDWVVKGSAPSPVRHWWTNYALVLSAPRQLKTAN